MSVGASQKCNRKGTCEVIFNMFLLGLAKTLNGRESAKEFSTYVSVGCGQKMQMKGKV